jgi:6,7-dimethyl-8-ribityllumazine synthase
VTNGPEERRYPFDLDESLRWPGEDRIEPDEAASENVTAFGEPLPLDDSPGIADDPVEEEEEQVAPAEDEAPEELVLEDPREPPAAEEPGPEPAAADGLAATEVGEAEQAEAAGEPEEEPEAEEAVAAVEELEVVEAPEHAPGALRMPDGVSLIEGDSRGSRRSVGIVVSRFNGEVTARLLDSAFEELERLGITRDLVTVMTVPGAFELPLAAMALAKTRRHACIVALGCVIRGDTPHFDYVAGEAASGLQLAALETGIPVAFGVLTLESAEQAEARIEKAAEAVRSGLEMADAFAQLRVTAAASG